ncbi:MAG: CDP-alcohol phosphatidyltransferase family protein [Candidatus Woesearchaeota archaeon]
MAKKRAERFGGDRKAGKGLLTRAETWIVRKYVSKVPSWLETYHLTYMTILWSALILTGSALAAVNIQWLWLVSFSIFMQYITDLFDGAVGRYRDTGLVKWGFYMDHFLDYIFLCSILIGYLFILPDRFDYLLFFILAIFGAFMINSYLSFAATNEFRIHYLGIGPTEVRAIFIIINTLLIFFSRTYMGKALPYVLVFSLLGLILVVYRNQKKLWDIDMENKRARAGK